MGFATSLGFKPTNIRSSSYGLFSEHLSRGKHDDFCTCKDAIRQACSSHINIKLMLYTCISHCGIFYESLVQANSPPESKF